MALCVHCSSTDATPDATLESRFTARPGDLVLAPAYYDVG
jgi:hypothetical protein